MMSAIKPVSGAKRNMMKKSTSIGAVERTEVTSQKMIKYGGAVAKLGRSSQGVRVLSIKKRILTRMRMIR
jgi:hypothetical protein